MGTAYRNRIGCDLISIYMLFYIFLLTFQSLVSAAVGIHCTDVKGKRFSG